MGQYVLIDGIANEYLEFMGYLRVAESDAFIIYSNKGSEFIIDKRGPRRLFVADMNDVPYLQNAPRLPAPPWD
jgi:hypothetical protein